MLLVREPGLIYVQINKNASSSLKAALKAKYPCLQVDHQTAWSRPEPKIAMWRNPWDRMESAYRMYRPEEEFSAWVVRMIVKRAAYQHDSHIKQQAAFCDFDGDWFVDEIIYWDFAAFAERFGLSEIGRENPSPEMTTDWSVEARQVFAEYYARDIEIWTEQA